MPRGTLTKISLGATLNPLAVHPKPGSESGCQVRRLEAALAEAQAGRAADAAAAHRLHEDQRARLAAAGRRLQTLVRRVRVAYMCVYVVTATGCQAMFRGHYLHVSSQASWSVGQRAHMHACLPLFCCVEHTDAHDTFGAYTHVRKETSCGRASGTDTLLSPGQEKQCEDQVATLKKRDAHIAKLEARLVARFNASGAAAAARLRWQLPGTVQVSLTTDRAFARTAL